MRVLVDENIPRMTVNGLCELGHDVKDIRGTAGQGLPDTSLWGMAVEEPSADYNGQGLHGVSCHTPLRYSCRPPAPTQPPQNPSVGDARYGTICRSGLAGPFGCNAGHNDEHIGQSELISRSLLRNDRSTENQARANHLSNAPVRSPWQVILSTASQGK